jgi:putative phosphoserine phosphatase/1-acylglycerol-3-phosphate O-acyltransferase
MGSHIIAVFDFDNTLTAGISIERSFLRYLLKNHRLKTWNLMNAALHYMKNIFKDPVEALKRNKMYLRGITKEQAVLWVREFTGDQGYTLISVNNFELVKSHKKRGHTTILISGAPDILVDALDMDVWFDRIYRTRLEVANDVLTGRIYGPHYYGKAKAKLVKLLEEEFEADLKESFCYSDSFKDVEMMSLFGHPVAVNPDRQLTEVARQRHWEIREKK